MFHSNWYDGFGWWVAHQKFMSNINNVYLHASGSVHTNTTYINKNETQIKRIKNKNKNGEREKKSYTKIIFTHENGRSDLVTYSFVEQENPTTTTFRNLMRSSMVVQDD